MLNQINIHELLSLSEEEFGNYHAVLKWQKPSAHLGYFQAKEFTQLPYAVVGEIRALANNPSEMPRLFHLVFGVSEVQFLNQQCQDLFTGLNYIKEQLSLIETIESKAFESDNIEDSELWKQAEGGRLQKYSYWNNTITLAEKFGKTPQEIGQMPYHEVLTVLMQLKDHGETTKRFYELKQKTTKNA
ncbi:MAG: hypothetical protein N4A45_10360 [Flavobacteriales bacterium]|jgi:hypothetical protein|nr:hypothetical protein [Flavobacteriales bacterium]